MILVGKDLQDHPGQPLTQHLGGQVHPESMSPRSRLSESQESHKSPSIPEKLDLWICLHHVTLGNISKLLVGMAEAEGNWRFGAGAALLFQGETQSSSRNLGSSSRNLGSSSPSPSVGEFECSDV